MLIISWNVAGWSHTVHRITDAYSSSATITAQQQEEGSNSKLLPPPSSSCKTAALQYYLHRHQVDILCLQEHKIPLSQLSSRSEPRQCSTIDGYESFWSCCVVADIYLAAAGNTGRSVTTVTGGSRLYGLSGARQCMFSANSDYFLALSSSSKYNVV